MHAMIWIKNGSNREYVVLQTKDVRYAFCLSPANTKWGKRRLESLS